MVMCIHCHHFLDHKSAAGIPQDICSKNEQTHHMEHIRNTTQVIWETENC